MLNLFDAVREIHEQDLPYVDRYVSYRDLLRQSCHTMLCSETIRLSDDFSRLTFLAKRQKLTDIQRFGLWQVWKRPDVIAWGQFHPTEAAYLSDLKALVWGIAALLDKPVPRDFQELLAGKVDFTVTSLIEGSALMKQYPDLQMILLDKPKNNIPMAFLMPIDDQQWLNFVNNWITIERQNGFFAELNKRWGVGSQE